MGEAAYGEDIFECCVKIPPGVLHACRVMTDFAHLFYVTSHIYNSNEEGRFPYDSPLVGHSWGENVIVSEKDKRSFVPTSRRALLCNL